MSLLTGTRLGRYDVGARIGVGGMGEVYQGRDERLGRDVAIKVLSGRFGSDAELRVRFEREAKAAARLSHPNIVAIYDVGEERGASYAVMELLRGSTLRESIKAGPIAPALAREYGVQVARALSAAHAEHIVHRDLKPENIFLTSAGTVKLLDFGIARLMDADPRRLGDARTIIGTKVGTLLGTVEYMSPEQVRESVVDHRSDLFSFGVVLYEMLTGVRPFAGDSPAELAASILTADPAPIGGARRTGALEAVARRCLQKRPADRYPSADAIEQALSTPTGEAPAPLPLDPRLTTASLSTDARRSVAVLPFVDLSLDQSLEFFCDGVAEEILDALSRVPGLRVAARSSSFQFRGRAGDARTIGQTLNVGTALEGSVRASGRRLRITTQLVDTDGGFQVWSARFDRELDDIFAVQDEIARAVVGALQVPQGETKLTALFGAGTTDLEAYTLYLKGRHHWNKRTEADLATAESYFEQALSRDPAYAEAQGALAQTLVTHGLYGTRAPADVMPQARAAARAALARQPALPSALATAACVDAVHGWDWEAAATAFQQGIALCPDAPTLHHWYAINCLVPQRRFAEARTELEVALVADPLSPAIVATLGLHGYFARHYESAETELRRALALHSDFAMAHLFLGLTCADTGRMDEARREVQEAAQLSPDSPEMTSAQGYVAARAGDDEAARGCLGALRAAAGHRYVSPVLMAQVHAALGETGEALTWIERAREVRAADLAWSLLRPVWDPLRAEPRFTAVRRAMHLAESDAV